MTESIITYDPFKTSHSLIWGLKTKFVKAINTVTNATDNPKVSNLKISIVEQYNGQCSTNEWLALYEILSTDMVSKSLKDINAFLNWEFPGTFLFAANHYAKTNEKKFSWVISSYYPQNDTNSNYKRDKFNIIKNNPKNSLIGVVNTSQGNMWSDGNIFSSLIPQFLSDYAISILGTINLYTGNGEIVPRPSEDVIEQYTFQLLRGEIETGLRVLSKGGVFIIKLYTFFTPQMLSLLIALKRVFEKSDIIKPWSIPSYKSDVYFVGVGYKGPNEQLLNSLTTALTDASIFYSIPTPSEKEYILNKLSYFVNRQILALFDKESTEEFIFPKITAITDEDKIKISL